MLATSEALLQILWEMSWQSGVIAFGVMAMQRTVGCIISARWRHALWVLVLLRLMMPVLPHSRFGLLPIGSPAAHNDGMAIPAQRFTPTPRWVVSTLVTDSLANPPLEKSVVASPTPFWRSPTTWLIGWFAVAFALVAIRVGANVRFHRRLRWEIEPASDRLIQLLNAACKRSRMRRIPTLCVTPLVDAPAVTGLLRSRILLPARSIDRLSDSQLNLILLHELSHIACGDVAIDWLWAVLTSIHWFNPILWAIGPIRRHDRELARDEMVLSLGGEQIAYGQLLIDLSQSARRPAFYPGLIGILSRKNRLARRVKMVAGFNGNRWYSQWFGVILLAVGGGCMLTAPTAKPPLRDSQSLSLSSADGPATMAIQSDADDNSDVDVQDDPITDQDRATLAALQQKIDVNFKAARFSEVVSSLAEKAHLKIFVDWRSLQQVNVRQDSLVTARFRDTKCSKALFVVFKAVQDERLGRLGFCVDDGMITLTTQQELDKNVVTRRYDINDLMFDPWDKTKIPESGAARTVKQAQVWADRVQEIGRYITDNVEPLSWKDKGGAAGSISSSSLRAVLLITQTPRAHRKIQRVLESLRAGRLNQVSVETRIFSLPEDVEDKLPENLRNQLAAVRIAGRSRRDQFLSDADVKRLALCLQLNTSTTGLTAPRLTLFCGQTGTVIVRTQQAYVSDLNRVAASTTRPSHYEPVVKTTNATAVTLTFTCCPSTDRATIFVDLHVELGRLIRLMSEQLGSDPAIGKIQRPVTEVRKVDNAYAIPDRSTLLLGPARTIDSGEANFNADSPDKARDDAEVEKLRQDSHVHCYVLIKPTFLGSK